MDIQGIHVDGWQLLRILVKAIFDDFPMLHKGCCSFIFSCHSAIPLFKKEVRQLLSYRGNVFRCLSPSSRHFYGRHPLRRDQL